MALVVVATFLTVTEAQIAAGALKASGLHPILADETFGSALWTHQFALQGFRLLIPEEEAADAMAFLAAVRSRKMRRPPVRASRYAWASLAVLLTFLFSVHAGWLAVAGLRRRRPRPPVLMIMFAAFAMILVGLAAVKWIASVWPTAGLFVWLVALAGFVVVVARLMRDRFEPGALDTPPAPASEAFDE
jgi:hypothetical protein